MAAKTTTFLIDMTKTRLQLHSESLSSARPASAFGIASDILRLEGPLGLYKGLTPAITRHLFYIPIRIVGYEHWLNAFVPNDRSLSLCCPSTSKGAILTIGLLSQIFTTIVCPLDNRTHPMANTSQTPNLEGLHCEIHAYFCRQLQELQNQAEECLPPLYHPPEGNERLKDYVKRFNQAILEVEAPGDKVVIMAMMEGLRPDLLFDSLSKNVPETLSALQNKSDKYIAAEELAEAKRRRRGKVDPKRKELDSRRSEYRDEARSKKYSQRSNMRSLSNGPKKSRLTPAGETGTSIGRDEEEVYNLSSPIVEVHPPITFNNDDLRGLHLPHDDTLVVSTVITNFNVQRILVDNRSSADILFTLAFNKMKIGLDKLHHFHTPLIGFGGNTMHPLGWIKLPITLGTEPHQITIGQDFIVVDYPSPYNTILGRPTFGGTRAITSTYHLKMKFPTSTGVGEVRGDQNIARQCFISAMKSETSTTPVAQ
ncbi:hypothetical protein Acr_00g0068290 [Actinidia rufa]|uniref:Mitochondrial substrate carrier family protein n=1 Tax=Actinidia rufa TaxID=165716 RepID=A0A7J0DQN0_9ERIC|nr:hypothetical protein Acr_00g0068290 [Actinidia rufa]